MKRIGKVLIMLVMLVSLWCHDCMGIQAEEYEYDSLNRVIKVTYEDGSYVEYEYDKNGNIVSVNVHEIYKGGTTEGEQNPPTEENGDSVDGKEENHGKPSQGGITFEDEGEEDVENPSVGEDNTPEDKEDENVENPSVEGDSITEGGNASQGSQESEEKDVVIKIIDNISTLVSRLFQGVLGWLKLFFK